MEITVAEKKAAVTALIRKLLELEDGDGEEA